MRRQLEWERENGNGNGNDNPQLGAMTHHGETLYGGYPLIDGVIIKQPLEHKALLPRPQIVLAVQHQRIGLIITFECVGVRHAEIGNAHRVCN